MEWEAKKGVAIHGNSFAQIMANPAVSASLGSGSSLSPPFSLAVLFRD
jgi:hypothetical protein